MLDTFFWKNYFRTYDILNIVIPYSELLKKLVSSLEIKNDDVILDAGAGTGNLSALLVDLGATVHALDSSQEGLEMAKNKRDKLRIVVHDLSAKLPFDDNYFTKIVSNNVIYTIDSSKRLGVFKEFYRTLKPGGRLVVANVRDGWSPINIYLDHLKSEFSIVGPYKLVGKILKMFVPTLKMFYYNSKIKKENQEGSYSFVKKYEQYRLLEQAGFIGVSEDELTYANQSILNIGFK